MFKIDVGRHVKAGLCQRGFSSLLLTSIYPFCRATPLLCCICLLSSLCLLSPCALTLLPLLRRVALCILRCHVVQCGSTPDCKEGAGNSTTNRGGGGRGKRSCICLPLHSSCHITLCMHRVYVCVCVCVCVCLFVLHSRVCVFISALMFPPLHVLCVSLSSCNKLPHPSTSPEALPFRCFFSLLSFCLKPALSYHRPARSIAHSLRRSPPRPPSPPGLPLPRVKCATSATLSRPSLGTLARAGR